MGKVTNQNFVCILFVLLRKRLQYKCIAWGIKYTSITEENTSTCSYPGFKQLEHHWTKYAVKYIHWSLFRSTKRIFANNDVKVSYKIIRKVNPSTVNHSIGAGDIMDIGLHLQYLAWYTFLFPKRYNATAETKLDIYFFMKLFMTKFQ